MLSTVLCADTLHVPRNFPTIQAALDAAANGAEIVLARGVYSGAGNRELDFHGKALTLRSATGQPATCVIDCGFSTRGFYFHCGETDKTVLSALTIRSGQSICGSAIACEYSSPTISDCVLTGNTANDGGALHCLSSSPTLVRCTISGNAASGEGGGIYCTLSNPTLTDCTITNNTAFAGGGGMYCHFSSPALSRVTFTRNSGRFGGALFCNLASPVLTDCTLRENAALGVRSYGGAVFAYASHLLLTGCTLANNSALGADARGGAVYAYYEPSLLLNYCTLTGNRATGAGGGVYCCEANATLRNCTLVDNAAGERGGGMYCQQSNPTLTNCIVWSNSPQAIASHGSTPLVKSCDVQGGWPGRGNLDVDPRFVGGGDLRLRGDSPCIDAGTTDLPPSWKPGDLPSSPPLLDGDGDGIARADLGSAEYAPPVRVVSGPEVPWDTVGDTTAWAGGSTAWSDAPTDSVAAVAADAPAGTAEPGDDVPGDLDCDGLANAGDIDAFLLAVLDPARYGVAYPGCRRSTADLNCDGLVDALDFQRFEACLNGDCAPCPTMARRRAAPDPTE